MKVLTDLEIKSHKIVIEGGDDNPHSLRLQRLSGHSWEIRNSSGNLFFYGGNNDANIERLRIDTSGNLYADGNLGLGIATPSEKIEVLGNIKADGFKTGEAELKYNESTKSIDFNFIN